MYRLSKSIISNIELKNVKSVLKREYLGLGPEVAKFESKLKKYEKILEDAKKEVVKIHIESKNLLDKDIQIKKEIIEKEIEKEILKAQKEISDLKKNSISDIQKISENIASDIIEKISGDKLNESSIKATVEDLSKKNMGKYL